MRIPILCNIFLAIYLHYINTDHRKKIIILDSGINPGKEIDRHLCKKGHKSFVSATDDPLIDYSGHGTLLAKVLAEKIDYKNFCILSYKFFGRADSTINYAKALNEIPNVDAEAVIIALENVSHFLDEGKWFRNIAKDKKFFIAAGNGSKNLPEDCTVYPACLFSKVNSPNFLVVGSSTYHFNQGGPIRLAENPYYYYRGRKHWGTSISTARAAGVYLSMSAPFQHQ